MAQGGGLGGGSGGGAEGVAGGVLRLGGYGAAQGTRVLLELYRVIHTTD